MRYFSSLLIFIALGIATMSGQSPQPIIVQAATAATPAAGAKTSVAPAVDLTATAIQLLQQMKAANDETLKKQEAALEQLDEVQKSAEQIKIFANRG